MTRELREQLPPRQSPACRLDGGLLHLTDAAPLPLPPELSALLAASDGTTPAQQIAERLLAVPGLHLESADDVYDLLEELADQGVVNWELEIPTFLAFPEVSLRSQLAATGSAGKRGIDALDAALEALDSSFERLTSTAATRRAGQMYAGRTVVYEDCQRDLDLRIGPALPRRLASPLALVLQSVRWYTWEIAEQFRSQLDQIFAQLCERTQTTQIGLGALWVEVSGRLSATKIAAAVTNELRTRWAEVLKFDPHTRHAEFRSEQLSDTISRTFAAPHPGWASASCHEVDLLLAAPSFAEATTEALMVLGEIHPAVNLAMRPVISVKECPFPETLVRAHEADVPGPRVAFLLPKGVTGRGTAWSPTPRDYDIAIGKNRSARSADHVLPIAELVAEHHGDRLWIRTRDSSHVFDAMAVFEYAMMQACSFRILPDAPHIPRITIDRLVVQREQWIVPRADLPFVEMERGVEQFVAVHRWARQFGIPRWFFVKVEEERKPVYVDLESPLYVEAFVKLARQSTRVSLSEMLPAVEDTWLSDAEGRTYTCELRMAAVDPVAWPRPTWPVDAGKPATSS